MPPEYITIIFMEHIRIITLSYSGEEIIEEVKCTSGVFKSISDLFIESSKNIIEDWIVQSIEFH